MIFESKLYYGTLTALTYDGATMGKKSQNYKIIRGTGIIERIRRGRCVHVWMIKGDDQ